MNIRYNPEGGPLDTYLSQLINKRFRVEVEKEEFVRGNSPVIRIDNVDFLNRNFTLSDKGLFYSKNGQSFRTFLYLQLYDVEKWGLPKKHLFFCETILKYTGFSIANRNRVDIECKETGYFHENVELTVCKHCSKIFFKNTGKQLYDGKDFNEIILDLEESDKTKNTETGTGGYVTNWNEISTAYRETKNYTCEKCGFKMKDRDGYKFMHVHHINGKTDNRRASLKCLCIKCHSNVDETHRRNFSTPYQQRQIREFIKKYK